MKCKSYFSSYQYLVRYLEEFFEFLARPGKKKLQSKEMVWMKYQNND